MDYKDIKKLMEDMGNSKLDSLDIEFPDGIKISMTKNSQKEVVVNTKGTDVIEASAPMTVPVVTEKQEDSLLVMDNKEENYKIVKSPMVGTFYESSSPDAEAFVKVGDKVQKGQVLCIVEAMKLMNEIESEFDGEIVEVCVKNEEVVEYGMPLFKIK
ncbi:MAG: acetyl-CoA carboxylase biotin carboxyl carrier protein [Clostridia bacterium]